MYVLDEEVMEVKEVVGPRGKPRIHTCTCTCSHRISLIVVVNGKAREAVKKRE